MRWKGEGRSKNVEDRRGISASRGVIGGGIGTVIIVLLALYFGIDPSTILQDLPESGPPPVTQQQQRHDASDQMADFVRDAFGHLKAIAVDKGGRALLKTANVGQNAGVVDVNDKYAFIAAAKARQ